MKLDDFNTITTAEARRAVLDCAHIDRWADAVVAARPFSSLTAAVEAARTCADPWTEEEIDAALARHPRIGERAEGTQADAAMSRAEQAGVPRAAITRTRPSDCFPTEATRPCSGRRTSAAGASLCTPSWSRRR